MTTLNWLNWICSDLKPLALQDSAHWSIFDQPDALLIKLINKKQPHPSAKQHANRMAADQLLDDFQPGGGFETSGKTNTTGTMTSKP